MIYSYFKLESIRISYSGWVSMPITRSQCLLRSENLKSLLADNCLDKQKCYKGDISWANSVLGHGKVTGCLLIKPLFSKYSLQIKYSKLLQTRGLFALSNIKCDTIICRATGSFSDTIPSNGFCYHVRQTPLKVLKLHNPTVEFPGNIINTANMKGKNNAVFRHHPSKTFITVKATKNIKKGEEILIPYGTKLTINTRKIAMNNSLTCPSSPRLVLNPRLINPSKFTICPKCNEMITDADTIYSAKNYRA